MKSVPAGLFAFIYFYYQLRWEEIEINLYISYNLERFMGNLGAFILRRVFVEFLGVYGTIALGCIGGGFFFQKDKHMQQLVKQGSMKEKTLKLISYGFIAIGVVLAFVQIYISNY